MGVGYGRNPVSLLPLADEREQLRAVRRNATRQTSRTPGWCARSNTPFTFHVTVANCGDQAGEVRDHLQGRRDRKPSHRSRRVFLLLPGRRQGPAKSRPCCPGVERGSAAQLGGAVSAIGDLGFPSASVATQIVPGPRLAKASSRSGRRPRPRISRLLMKPHLRVLDLFEQLPMDGVHPRRMKMGPFAPSRSPSRL